MKHSIKRKLQSVFLVFVLFILANCAIFYIYLNRIQDYQNTLSDLDRLRILTLETRKYENNFQAYDTRSNDFMESGVSRNLILHHTTMNSLKTLIANLQKNKIVKNLGVIFDMENVKVASEEYSSLFDNLSKLVRERGFKDYGWEGQMRKAVHQLENNSSLSKEKILTLRRHEKDFFLRKDTAYVNKLWDVAQTLRKSVTNPTDLQMLNDYLNFFDKIVVLEKQIGLDEQSGDRGRIYKLMQEIDTKINALHQKISENIRSLVNESLLIMAIAAISLLVLAGIFGLGFAHSLSKPIITLDSVAQSVVKNGIQEQELMLDSIHSQDEVGNLARDFKTMLLQLKSHMIEIDSQNEQLKKVGEIETQRVWGSEGLLKVSDILRQHNMGMISKFSEFIFTVVRHLGGHQGAIYVVEDSLGTPSMELKAYFASRQKEQTTIQYGEGLIGEVWRRKELVVLKDIQIPKQYTKVAQGLGYATPRTVVIVPITIEEYVLGAMEIASLYDVSEHEIDFLKRVAQQVASHLVLIKLTDLNKKLVNTLNEHRIFPSPEAISGATHNEILEMLRRQQ